MSQVLHIFKKDARHLWPEILASLVLTALFVLIYPNTWLPQQYPGRRFSAKSQRLSSSSSPSVGASLITRLVHSESLVGDRQFWITRPYEWKKLLAAKAPLPSRLPLHPHLHCAQLFCCERPAFIPSPTCPACSTTCSCSPVVLVLPLIALATVTSSFARMILTLLGIIVAIIAMVASGL